MPTEAEIQRQVERIFWEADTDRSGTISMDELHTMLLRNGYMMSREQFYKDFSSFDTDGNQEISYDEYLRAMGRPEKEWKRFALYRRMFEKYDKSGDGYITRWELAAVFKELGKEISQRQLEVLFAIIDRDGSGRIEFDEFLSFFFRVRVPSVANKRKYKGVPPPSADPGTKPPVRRESGHSDTRRFVD